MKSITKQLAAYKIIITVIFISLIQIAAGTTVYVYRIDGKAVDELFLVSALQGIVNRKGPRLFLYAKAGNHQHLLPDYSDRWIEYYKACKDLQFEPIEGLDDLINKFRSEINGLVIHDPENDATTCLAMTAAGLDNLLPVTSSMQALKSFQGLPVKYNFSEKWSKREKLAAYEWALENLMPRCSKKIACSVGNNIKSGDYVVMKKGFFFRLSYRAADGEIQTIGKILKALDAPAAVYGWGEPTEHEFMHVVSQSGNFTMGLIQPGLSFHAQVPAKTQFSQLRHLKTGETNPEKKYYIAFLTAEGDTPKAALSFIGGQWLDGNRGSIPVNWGMNPLIASEFPALYEYYIDSAKPNDYFFSACSGAGYLYTAYVPDISKFAAHTDRHLRIADLRYQDIWSFLGEYRITDEKSLAVTGHYLKNSSFIKGVLYCFHDLKFPNIMFMNGETPVCASGLSYWQKNTALELKTDIEKTVENIAPPYFLFIYLGLDAGHADDFKKGGFVAREIPTFLNKTAALLDSDKFKIVNLDDFFNLMKFSGKCSFIIDNKVYTAGDTANLELIIRNFNSNTVRGSAVAVMAPEGWKPHTVNPSVFTDIPPGGYASVKISLLVPENIQPGNYIVKAGIAYGSDRLEASAGIKVRESVRIGRYKAVDILQNGNFKDDNDRNGIPDGWKLSGKKNETAKLSIIIKDNITKDQAIKIENVTESGSLITDMLKIDSTCSYELQGMLKTGQLNIKKAYIELKLFDHNKKFIKFLPAFISDDTKEWKTCSLRVSSEIFPPQTGYAVIACTVIAGGHDGDCVCFSDLHFYRLFE